MLQNTRPINVADNLANDASCPTTLNLLKSGLVGAQRSATPSATKCEAAQRRVEPRKVELPKRRLDLAERRDAKGHFDLSDDGAKIRETPGVKPGAGNVEDIAATQGKPRGAVTAAVVDKPAQANLASSSNREEPTIHSAALARVVSSWPHLSPSIQAAMLAMVEAVEAGLDDARP